MKDREKQIEEMGKDVCGNINTKMCANGTCPKIWDCPYSNTMAEILIEKGWVKLSEDSVVLSREELNEIIDQTKETEKNYYKRVIIPQEHKKTAEKIWLQAKTIVDKTKHLVQGREYLHIDALKEIIKSCGVEIKE